MMETIVVQGAVSGELREFMRLLPGGELRAINGYEFYEAALNGRRVIVSKTGVGIINAAISTMTALNEYKPSCVINQGTAGGHTREMRYGDIVIGATSVYLNNMRMPLKGPGEGSDALEWRPGRSNTIVVEADERLVRAAEEIEHEGRVIVGRLGAGDIFSREADRIDWLHERMGQLCEDMESVAVYKACAAAGVPVLGVRIISNNELVGPGRDDDEKYERAQAGLQGFIWKLIERLCGAGEIR